MHRSANTIKVRFANVKCVKLNSKIASGDIHVNIVMAIWLALLMMCTYFGYL